MASIKTKFRPSKIDGKEGTIYYQVIHERKVRLLPTDYKVFPSEWDEKRAMLICKADTDRLPILICQKERIRHDLERLGNIIRKFETSSMFYTVDDIAYEFKRYSLKYSLYNYMESIIISLKQKNKTRTAETYRSALNSFKKYRDYEDIMLDAITSETIEQYEAYLKGRGNIPNTTSFYMRILRAVYNRAVENEIIENRNPFRRVYTGVGKTVKRALPIQIMKIIKSLDLSLFPKMDYARDMFLLSFFLRGMSFIDMAFLRKSDLKYGYVTYRRRKTGQTLRIAWTKDMQTILDKYPENPTQYLLPILTKNSINERHAYRNTGYNINRQLKKIAAEAGVNIPLSLYCARHSWASAAKAKGIPISVISEGMGHDSETTTQIYLASLETSVIDKANSLILRSI